MNTGTAIVAAVGLLVVGGVAYMMINRPQPQLAAAPGNTLPAAQFLPAAPNTPAKVTNTLNTVIGTVNQGIGIFNELRSTFGELF